MFVTQPHQGWTGLFTYRHSPKYQSSKLNLCKCNKFKIFKKQTLEATTHKSGSSFTIS